MTMMLRSTNEHTDDLVGRMNRSGCLPFQRSDRCSVISTKGQSSDFVGGICVSIGCIASFELPAYNTRYAMGTTSSRIEDLCSVTCHATVYQCLQPRSGRLMLLM